MLDYDCNCHAEKSHDLQGVGLCCAFDIGVNGAQMEVLETRKNISRYVVRCVPREASGCFLE